MEGGGGLEECCVCGGGEGLRRVCGFERWQKFFILTKKALQLPKRSSASGVSPRVLKTILDALGLVSGQRRGGGECFQFYYIEEREEGVLICYRRNRFGKRNDEY